MVREFLRTIRIELEEQARARDVAELRKLLEQASALDGIVVAHVEPAEALAMVDVGSLRKSFAKAHFPVFKPCRFTHAVLAFSRTPALQPRQNTTVQFG